MNIPFERTVCACDKDVANCKKRPGPLAPGDLERIASYLMKEKRITHLEQVFPLLRASMGPIVQKMGVMRRIGTIVPSMKIERREIRYGGCVFLDEENRCSIHPVAPFGCAYIDEHMTPEEGNDRSSWAYRQILTDRAYQSQRRELAERYGEIEPFPMMDPQLRSAPQLPPEIPLQAAVESQHSKETHG